MKRGKIIIIGLAMLLLVVMLIPTSCIPAGDKIAVISLSGTITAQSSFFGSAITPELVKEQLDRAEKDGAVKAIVLRIESPGGVVAPCQEILEEIEKRLSRQNPLWSVWGVWLPLEAIIFLVRRIKS